MIFLVVYYRLSGVNAVVALFLNLFILMAFMAYAGAVLTLPGIAGVILTIAWVWIPTYLFSSVFARN